jgi:hypothetical protein
MRYRTKLIAALLLAALLAACGGGSGKDAKVKVEATPAALRQVADKTLAQGTAHVTFTMDMQIQGQSVSMPGEGDIDAEHHLARMSFNLASLASSFGDAPDEVKDAFDQDVEVVMSGSVMYMKFPLFASALGADGKEWVKFDLAAKNEGLGELLGGSGGGFGTDPSNFLSYLRGAGKVEEVGQEDVNGAATTHFSGSYTLREALDAAPESARSALEDALSDLPSGTDTREMPYDVWIGDDGLVRRMTMTFEVPGSGSAGGGLATMTMDFSDYGEDVDITVPSDDEATDLGDLLGAISDGSSFSTTGSSIN